MSGADVKDLSVLVVDDNEPMRLLLRKMLSDLGILDVTTANDGIEALKMMRQRLPDLVITDQQMAPLDGLELVRELRTSHDANVKDIPVIMITGHMAKNVLRDAVKVGVNDFLAKPISPATLKERVLKVVG
jgi:CheY-like chemotaxis protein